MIKSATRSWSSPWITQVALIFSASLFVAICAHIAIPLPFSPVPLTLQNFAVLVVGLALGGRRAFAALLLYLAEGLCGLPVFSPVGPGGAAQLLGPTGGYLMAYPFVAFVAGWIAERGRQSFARFAIAATAAEIVLFIGGVSWLAIYFPGQAVHFGLYPFVFAEVAKILVAAGARGRLSGTRLSQILN